MLNNPLYVKAVKVRTADGWRNNSVPDQQDMAGQFLFI